MAEDHKIIVIGRSFGSGARKLGKELSRRLGIGFYDKELLATASRDFGYSPDIFAQADEKKPSLLKRFVCQSYGIQEAYQPETLCGESLYQAQSDVIKRIVAKGPCVIIGRTADYILRDHKHLLSIFLHAPDSHRVMNIMERGDAETEEKALELARKIDKERESYYNFFTGKRWGAASNYHLTMDSSMMTTENLAEFIAGVYKNL